MFVPVASLFLIKLLLKKLKMMNDQVEWGGGVPGWPYDASAGETLVARAAAPIRKVRANRRDTGPSSMVDWEMHKCLVGFKQLARHEPRWWCLFESIWRGGMVLIGVEIWWWGCKKQAVDAICCWYMISWLLINELLVLCVVGIDYWVLK